MQYQLKHKFSDTRNQIKPNKLYIFWSAMKCFFSREKERGEMHRIGEGEEKERQHARILTKEVQEARLHSISAPRLESIYEKLFTAPTNFKYGSIYKVKPTKDVWTIFWEPERLYELTTFTMMSTICAALNSQRRLLWVIGVGRNRKVLGCEVSNEERDTLSQAFIYCVRSGILPQLHPELVQLRFISVDDQLDDKDNTRLLVEIVIEHKVSTNSKDSHHTGTEENSVYTCEGGAKL
ncbi:hypothetical protein Y032_0105g3722 [Ancylostoma ceylanicum]|uniref:Schlafen AlbA-2 domain-containing protein n=1 Tax=Ancylostoma ceylanicum TaxID=53326 RepID=A0A016TFM6_9BILA|nr:hypothetical protein Y032_0105g3722 [Ancylostoma ceylanicum]